MTLTLKTPGPRSLPKWAKVPSGALLGLVLLLLFNLCFTDHFLSLQTLNINMTQVSTIVIVAVGMTMVIATGGIDLSVGSLMAISGALAPLIFGARTGLLAIPAIGMIVAIVLPILAASVGGVLNGTLVARFRIQPIVATLILFIAGRGVAQVLTNGNLQTFSHAGFRWLGLGKVLGIPFQVLLMLAIVLVAAWVMRSTLFGRYILATGGNERAARLAGIPVQRVKLAVYVICGALSGLAGLLVIAINSSADANLIGLGIELDAIAAVAVGGTLLTGGRARIVGTLVGALIIQLVRYTLLAHGVPDAAALVVKAGIILVAVYLQKREN
ncbi:ABC transporter permease [Amantichitinum ursilacus]|uniref:Ribose transport system permease protein RbsC n=1 Tax=Amantichitinum ursilacus TaxID=857265 RepID=A0A0N0GM67_9NEIS|nr:ABC transporter permease [Amantichitinum ursilacus]KPC50778.1 Ribose transport system permease protein RbsC [Amantichitinum ursilacus]